MKCALIFSLLCVFLIPSVMATDPGPKYDYTKIYDIPNDQLIAQYGRLPGKNILLMDGLEDECPGSICHLGDTLKMLAILLEWDDRPSTYPSETIDSMLFSRGYWPGGSVAEYFDEVSFGNLTLVGDAQGWFNAGSTFDKSPDLAWFDSMVIALDPYIDYSRYDGNGDGYVDAICFIQAGNCIVDSYNSEDPGAYAWWTLEAGAVGPLDGVKAWKFHTSMETRPLLDPDNPNLFTGEDTVSAIVSECHEFSHNIGLPDLYDRDFAIEGFTTPGDQCDNPLVDWCVMDGAQRGNAFEVTDPAHHCGWAKMKLQWLDAITLDGEYEDLVIYNIEAHYDSALYKIPISLEDGEYFLLEYRNPYSNHRFGKYTADFSKYFYPSMEYGADLFDRGLLITHICDSAQGQSLPFYAVSNNGYPDYDHYVVRVIDAGYDPYRDYTFNPGGDVYDGAQWWYPYETRLGACFSSDTPGQSEFGPFTYPNSSGYHRPSGVYVRVDSLVGDRLYMYVNTDTTPTEYVCGDANGDGAVTQADVAYLIEFLHKDGPYPFPYDAGDANGDGVVDNLDAKYLVEYLHKDGPEPICP